VLDFCEIGKAMNGVAISITRSEGFRMARHSFMMLAVVAVAVIMGIMVCKEAWLLVGAMAACFPILLYPVAASLGGYALLLPFEAVYVVGGTGRSLAWLVGGAAAAVLLGTGLASGRVERPPRATLWWTLFIFWSAATVLWAVDQQVALHALPTLFSLWILYTAAVSVRVKERELRSIAVLCIIGGCATALVATYMYYQGGYGELSWRGSLGETNPNSFGLTLLLPISLTIAYFLSVRRGLSRILLLATLVVISFGILVTISRESILALVIVALVYLYRFRRDLKKLLPIILLLVLPTAAMPHFFFQRLEESSVSRGSGRLDIWHAGLAALKHYILQGTGIANFPVVYTDYAGYAPKFLGYGRDAHNVYLAVGVELGIVGFALFALAIGSQFAAATHAQKFLSGPDPLLVGCEAACWGMLVGGLFATVMWIKAFWLSWMLLALTTRLRERQPLAALAKAG
jgi:O-antigen ligase